MKMEVLPNRLCMCKIDSVKGSELCSGFFFLSRTDSELSLVCDMKDAPSDALGRMDDLRAFRIGEELDPSLTGILSRISSVLADAGISLFVVSTYDTDYFLVRDSDLDGAVSALNAEGYEFVNRE